MIVLAMLFAGAEAAGRPGLERLSELVAAFIGFGGQALLRLAVIAIGSWIAGLVADAIRRGGSSQAPMLATIARVARPEVPSLTRRAASVRDYLVGEGIDASRLIALGYGESRPVADNGTTEGRARSRRVELTRID